MVSIKPTTTIKYTLVFLLCGCFLNTCVYTEHAHQRDSSPQVIMRKTKKQKIYSSSSSSSESGSNLMITKDIFMNSWAVRVVGDDGMAQKVAVENGFIYKGKVNIESLTYADLVVQQKLTEEV